MPQGDPLPSGGTDPWNHDNWTTLEPFVESNGSTTYLRQGWTKPRASGGWAGWGWRHIAAKHGWGPIDRIQTEQALLSPIKVDTSGDALGPTTRTYFGAVFSLNGVVCIRKVVVRFAAPRGRVSYPPRGIITSHGTVYIP
jgi:hypothetical protein